ncbi:MAG: oxygen-independent coproporphyrinogen III oxidase [Clostridia bacterium]|nr:oxygen-independent coproporphyrinogen III oxidase [Clostridia bacterium]
MKDLALYIHIPFCKQKCLYCDFCSFQNKDDLIDTYIKCLCLEIKSYKEKVKDHIAETIYIGGGTPSYIEPKNIEEIIKCVRENFLVDDDIEFTIEVNPGTVNENKFDIYKKIGINRISFGVQSSFDDMLKSIGRIHTYNEFLNNYKLAREKGFNNISVDLIFGLPNQTISMWEKTLDEILKLKPNHISCYSLKVEENTPFFKLQKEGKLILPSEEVEREMYHLCINKLRDNGYNQYEISNFSLPGFESKHNLVYWKRKDYLGLGLNAASCIENTRFSNEVDINKYIDKINNNENVVIFNEELDEKEILKEKIMLNLRLNEGLNLNEILVKLNKDEQENFLTNVNYLMDLGLISKEENKIKLTVKGIDVSNQIFIKLMEV